jgi:hypothetical protein
MESSKMDKALFKAYIREIVKEEIEASVERTVKRILPEILGEAVQEIKKGSVQENTRPPSLSRERMAQLLNIDVDGDTLTATAGPGLYGHVAKNTPDTTNPAVAAITRDYGELMKKMGLAK